MPHFCRICKRSLSNESFSGKGHRIHVCRECTRLPRLERLAIEAEEEIAGFLLQSRISQKNLNRLRQLSEFPVPRVASLAELFLELAAATPFKRKRFSILRAKHPKLLASLLCSGIDLPEYALGSVQSEYDCVPNIHDDAEEDTDE